MSMWKLLPDRYAYVRSFCHNLVDEEKIRSAAIIATGHNEELEEFLVKHVTREDYGYIAMQLDGLPVSNNTFRLLRQKYYWILSNMLPNTHSGGNIDGEEKGYNGR